MVKLQCVAWQCVACLLVLTAFPVLAQEGVTTTVTKEDCRRLVKHIPADDVAYKPGVDVYGNAVTPADTADNQALRDATPTSFEFNLNMAVPNVGDTFSDNTSMSAGTIKYDINKGSLTYNGVPLQGGDQQRLGEECRKLGVR